MTEKILELEQEDLRLRSEQRDFASLFDPLTLLSLESFRLWERFPVTLKQIILSECKAGNFISYLESTYQPSKKHTLKMMYRCEVPCPRGVALVRAVGFKQDYLAYKLANYRVVSSHKDRPRCFNVVPEQNIELAQPFL